ncbi:MAG TPA: hypothetical protein VF590_18505, partial [Isosphaeraceae bacterium]
YAGVSGGVFLVAWLVRATLRRWKFEAFDRHLGMLLGGAEGVLLGVLATVIVLSVAPRSRRPILESPSGRFVGGLLREVQPLLPGEVRDMLAPSWGGPGAMAAEEGPRRLLSLPRRDALVRPAAGAPSWTHPAEDPAPAGEGPDEAPGLRSLLHEGSARLGRALADELRRQAEQADQPYDGRIKRR